MRAAVKDLVAVVLDRLKRLGRDKLAEMRGRVLRALPGLLGDRVGSRLPGGTTKGAGIGTAALLGAAKAKLAGKNPIIGALRGAVAAIPTRVKIALCLLAVAVLLLAPVLAVLVLVGLLVAGIVLAIRAATR
jgi:hypothetical protein